MQQTARTRASIVTFPPRLARSSAGVRAVLRQARTLLRHSVLPDADAPLACPVMLRDRRTWDTARFRLVGLLLMRRTVLALAVLTLLLVLGTIGFRFRYDDRIYPAVIIGDVPVGGLTLPEAERHLAVRTAALERGLVTFTMGHQTWTPTLHDLGGSVNVDATLNAAYATGRRGAAVDRFAFPGRLLSADQTVPVQMQLNARVLETWFDAVDRDLGQPAVDARIVIAGTEITIVEGSSGIVVDRAAAMAQIRAAMAGLVPVTMDLPTTTVPPTVRAADLRQTQARLAEIVGTPVVATFDDVTWSIAGHAISSYLTVESVATTGTPTFQVTVEEEGLAAMLRQQVGDQVNRPPVNADLGWDGGVVVRAPASTGVTLDATAFAGVVASSFLEDHRAVTVPVVITEPAVDDRDVDALGIETLLGEGDSNFSGGAEGRDANVRVAASYLNGTLVEPGGVFSFNEAIGEISYERGYQGALVAQAGEVAEDAGGGACQVSTTVFRAALNAGMPIVEWYAHTVRLPNYELDGWGPGFDASILQYGPDPAAWPDFKFENYSRHWLLIMAEVAYPHVFVRIYGTSDGRSVSLDTATLGTNAFAVTRVITDADGTVIADRTFPSYYEG